jgi:hypothetical protein
MIAKPMMKRITLVRILLWTKAGISETAGIDIAKITAKKNTAAAATPPIIVRILINSCFVGIGDLNLALLVL